MVNFSVYILIMYDCEVITTMVAARKLGMLDDPHIKYAFITSYFINGKLIEFCFIILCNQEFKLVFKVNLNAVVSKRGIASKD